MVGTAKGVAERIFGSLYGPRKRYLVGGKREVHFREKSERGRAGKEDGGGTQLDMAEAKSGYHLEKITNESVLVE